MKAKSLPVYIRRVCGFGIVTQPGGDMGRPEGFATIRGSDLVSYQARSIAAIPRR